MNIIEDETDYFQFGQQTLNEFFYFDMISQKHSTRLIDQNEDSFKYTSLQLTMWSTQTIYGRSTLDAMTFLGDIGGMYDALFLIGVLFTTYHSTANFQNNFVKQMFHFVSQPYLPRKTLEFAGTTIESPSRKNERSVSVNSPEGLIEEDEDAC